MQLSCLLGLLQPPQTSEYFLLLQPDGHLYVRQSGVSSLSSPGWGHWNLLQEATGKSLLLAHLPLPDWRTQKSRKSRNLAQSFQLQARDPFAVSCFVFKIFMDFIFSSVNYAYLF